MNLFKGLKILLLGLMLTLKTKKVVCKCGGLVKVKIRNGQPSYTSLVVYSRAGSEECHHYEYR